MKPGDVVIVRLYPGRVRVGGETIAPGEIYARLLGVSRSGAARVLVGGAEVRSVAVREAPKAVQP